MKGIILAGGVGTRLAPLTLATSKQLLPVYDKPMIYYPICTLMLAGVRQILLITTPHEQSQFMRLLGDGSQWGIEIKYEIQDEPKGIAEAFIIGREFIAGEQVALILGDNIFYGAGMGTALSRMTGRAGATVFAYEVSDPQRFGVLSFNDEFAVTSIEEKPAVPKSNFVIPGLYFFDNSVIERSLKLIPSRRNELEITDLLGMFLNDGQLNVEILNRDITWLDTGTLDSLFEASNRVRNIELDIGRKINVPEEIAWKLGYITTTELLALAKNHDKSGYGDYLLGLI